MIEIFLPEHYIKLKSPTGLDDNRILDTTVVDQCQHPVNILAGAEKSGCQQFISPTLLSFDALMTNCNRCNLA